jgi:hypothetical protein
VRSFDLLYGAMVPDRRASKGEISAGEQVMVATLAHLPTLLTNYGHALHVLLTPL